MAEFLRYFGAAIDVVIVTTAIVSLLFRQTISSAIQNYFKLATDSKLEKLKQKIRTQEGEIQSLRSGAIEANTKRFMLVQERQIEALEALWESTINFSRLNFLVEMRKGLNMGNAAAEVEKNPDIARFFGEFIKPVQDPKDYQSDVKKLEMYIPENIWKMYQLYSMRNFLVYAEFLALSSGLNPHSFVEQTVNIDSYIEFFPNSREFLEEHGPSGADHLQAKLYQEIIAAIRKFLAIEDGHDALLTKNLAVLEKAQDIAVSKEQLRNVAPELVRENPIPEPQD